MLSIHGIDLDESSVDRLHLDDGPIILRIWPNDAVNTARDFKLVADTAKQNVDIGLGGIPVILFGVPVPGETILTGNLPVDIIVDVLEELLGALGWAVEIEEDLVNLLACWDWHFVDGG